MNEAVKACVQVDTFLYFARVITFDFASNGTRLSIFRQNQTIHS